MSNLDFPEPDEKTPDAANVLAGDFTEDQLNLAQEVLGLDVARDLPERIPTNQAKQGVPIGPWPLRLQPQRPENRAQDVLQELTPKDPRTVIPGSGEAMLSAVGGGGTIQALQEIARDKRVYDLPELLPGVLRSEDPNFEGKSVNPDLLVSALTHGFELARWNQFAMADIYMQNAASLKDHFPNADFMFDHRGQLILLPNGIEGQAYYANSEGLSANDVGPLTLEVGVALGMQKLASGFGKGLLARAGFTAGAAGGSELILESMAGAAGSRQPTDYTRALFAAALAPAGEAGEFATKRSARLVANIFRSYMNRRTGVLPDDIARFLVDNDIRVDLMTSENGRAYMNSIFAQLEKGVPLDQAVRFTDMQTLPSSVPGRLNTIPGTKARVTQDPSALSFEQASLQREYGFRVAGLFEDAQANANAAARQVVEDTRSTIGSGARAFDVEEDAIEVVRDTLISMNQASQASVSAAYRAARASGGQVQIVGVMDQFAPIAREAFVERWGGGNVPRVLNQLDELDGVLARAGTQDKTITLKALDNWRKTNVKAIGAADNATEQDALRTLNRAFDDTLDKMLAADLLEGGEDALELWKNARSSAHDRFVKFEAKDNIAKVVAPMLDGGPIDAGSAVNYLMGRTVTSAPSRNRAMWAKLKGIIGEDSEEWLAVKEAFFLRLMRNQPDDLFKPELFNKQLKDFLQKNREVAEIIYSPAEIEMIKQFDRAAMTAGENLVRRPEVLVTATAPLRRLWRAGNVGLMGAPIVSAPRSMYGRARAMMAQFGVPMRRVETTNLTAALSQFAGSASNVSTEDTSGRFRDKLSEEPQPDLFQ